MLERASAVATGFAEYEIRKPVLFQVFKTRGIARLYPGNLIAPAPLNEYFALTMLRSVTGIIIATNAVVYAITNYLEYAGIFTQNEILSILGLVPVNVYAGAIWQPITSMFMHAPMQTPMGILHIFINMFALYSLGLPIEKMMGKSRYLLLYFISGLMGALLVILFQPPISVTVGASGAVVGILGSLAIFYPNSRLMLFFIPMKAKTAAIVIGVGSIALAVTGSADVFSHWGHLGGLIGGLLYSRYVLKLKRSHETFHHYDRPEGQQQERYRVYRLDPRTGEIYPEDEDYR